MLYPNIFEKETEDIVEKVFLTLLSFNKEYNSILKVDNLEEASGDTKHVLSVDGAVEAASVISSAENKNVFLINEAFNDNLKNINTNLQSNFYKLYYSLNNLIPKLVNKEKSINLSILNMHSPRIHSENVLENVIHRESLDIKNDVAMLRSIGGINIFVPADAKEAEYLLKIAEKNISKKNHNNVSYFKMSGSPSPKIFAEEFFEKDGNLKEWTGMPDIMYLSKNIEAPFEVAIIACGPIIYNTIIAARELEEKNYKVTILNVSLLNSSSEYLNQKIKTFINNFVHNHKNILTVEEHSKIGGLGSLVAESVLENRHSNNVRVERLGIEDDLSARNIIGKCEEIVGF